MPSDPNNSVPTQTNSAGETLNRIAETASNIDVSHPCDVRNNDGFQDKGGRWVQYGE